MSMSQMEIKIQSWLNIIDKVLQQPKQTISSTFHLIRIHLIIFIFNHSDGFNRNF